MNVEGYFKVDNALLYRTVSLKVEEVRLHTTKGGSRRACGCAAVVARRV
jgi:hypothetical protein